MTRPTTSKSSHSANASHASDTPKRAGGRPPKFGEPSRAVTLTLPERVFKGLARIDYDRARAITKLVDHFIESQAQKQHLVELLPITQDRALILVPACPYLQSLPWLHLVEISPARYLLVLIEKTAIEKLEVTLCDLLEEIPSDDATNREILSELLEGLRIPRRNQKVAKEEIIVVDR